MENNIKMGDRVIYIINEKPKIGRVVAVEFIRGYHLVQFEGDSYCIHVKKEHVKLLTPAAKVLFRNFFKNSDSL